MQRNRFINKFLKAPFQTTNRFNLAKFPPKPHKQIFTFKIHRHTLKVDQVDLTKARSILAKSIKKIYFVTAKCHGNTVTSARIMNRYMLGVLYDKFPTLSKQKSVLYKRIVQTGCRFDNLATGLFHGFVIEVDPSLNYPKNNNVKYVEKLLSVKRKKLLELQKKQKGSESIIYKVLQRNPQWKKMLIVTDVTGSMTPYVGQIIIWHRLNLFKSKIKHFVFFNDGDLKPDSEKKIGKTGGIYSIQTNNYQRLRKPLSQALRGSGGDSQENDIEAILKGLQECKDCKDIVLIADSHSPMRDYLLIKKINKPVKVILCGPHNGLVHKQYLELARKTGGSLHTIDKDIIGMMKKKEGESIQIGKRKYIIKNGKFHLQKPGI